MKLAAVLLLCLPVSVCAQAPQVPHKMQFAGMTLTIRDDARKEIQKDVDMLTQSPKHLNIKVERAKTYFPTIEKIFAEERVPDDFKYLVLQESALIGDAVSVSNAVGFWQFKDFTAIEMGLKVNRDVDERMSIAASTRGAALYLKKNNYYFNNWLYAMQAYQMGAGGVMKVVKDFESGTKHMEITSRTYWYVKKFLAHKIAFEDIIKGSGDISVVSVINRTKKSMEELATEFAVSEEVLRSYNKWVLKDHVPGDDSYEVTIPIIGVNTRNATVLARTENQNNQATRVEAKLPEAKNEIILVNGISAVKVHSGETIAGFVKRSGIDISFFLKCNDLSISDKLIAGDYYYLKRKKTKADVMKYVAQQGDNLWLISQKFGVQLRKLRKYNGASDNLTPTGSVVFLAGKRTVEKGVDREVVEIDSESIFNWTIEPMMSKASDQLTQISSVELEKEVLSEAVDSVKVESLTLASMHTVSVGETLYSIAKRYQVGVMEIVQWNNLRLEDGIRPGQVLNFRIPEIATSVVKPTEIMHEVRSSDTLYSVARQYGVTIKEIMDWNKKNDFTLTLGENLRILKK